VGTIHKLESDESKILGDPLDALEQISAVDLGNGDIMRLIENALRSDASLGQIVQSLKNLEARSLR
jgi:hypothetical protein